MKLLVSVRSIDEALVAADGGADFIDLKEPRDGALGGLPVATVAAIVAALRRHGAAVPVSATIGDLPMTDRAGIEARVEATGAVGVDYVKVGIERAPEAGAVLDALARSGRPVVPVFIADAGLDWAHVGRACAHRFPGLMLDTAAKRAGSLFDALPDDVLQRFVTTARASGARVGLAGALRAEHAPRLHRLAPDFAGFRTAVCAGDRGGVLDPARLRALVDAMGRPSHRDAAAVAAQAGSPPFSSPRA